ncbi:MAG: NYN domain-containing protein [Candidatus Omnitrophota bacterium]
MSVTLVVDAYNAINAIPRVRKLIKQELYSSRKAILDISREYVRSSGYITDLKVVFDGKDKYRGQGILHSKDHVFSATGKGDDRIIEIIKACSRKGRVVVASNDNYVRNNGRAYGASLIRSEELVKPKGIGKKTRGLKVEKRSRASKIQGKRLNADLENEITRKYGEELGLK